MTQYAMRIADIEGVRRLALLVAELHAEGVSVADAPGALAEAQLRNPYTEAAFAWAPPGRVMFTGEAPAAQRHHSLEY